MICLNFDHAKNQDYLGLREINRNSITMGPTGNLFIEEEVFPYPQIKIKIQEGKLIFQCDSEEHYVIHNGKRSRLPLVTNKGDKIDFGAFRITVVDFENIKYNSYRNFTNQALEDTQKNPLLIKLVSQLTSYLD